MQSPFAAFVLHLLSGSLGRWLQLPLVLQPRVSFYRYSQISFHKHCQPRIHPGYSKKRPQREVKDRDNSDPTRIFTILRKNVSLFLWLRLFLALVFLQNSQIHTVGATFSQRWEWELDVFKIQGLMRAGRKHSTPLCSHQHSIVYVHITRWLWQGNAG